MLECTLLTQALSEQEACTSKDFEVSVSFRSLTSEYELYCGKSHYKQRLETLIMMAGSVLTLCLSVVQDSLGRKRTMVLGVLMPCFGMALLCLVDSLLLKALGLMLFWSFGEVVTIASTVLSSELLVNPLRKLSVTIYQIVIILGGLTGHFLSQYLDSYKSFMALVFWGYLLSVGLIHWFLPESPSFLLRKGAGSELRAVIRRIARTNRLISEQTQKVIHNLDSLIECTLQTL